MFRKTLVTAALTAVMVGGTAGVASAYECFIASRSDQGNAGATKSANWETIAVSDLFAQAHYFFGDRALTEAEVGLATDMAAEQGLPSSFTVFAKHTIPRSTEDGGAPSPKSSDGKGVDHFATGYGDQLGTIYFALVQPAP